MDMEPGMIAGNRPLLTSKTTNLVLFRVVRVYHPDGVLKSLAFPPTPLGRLVGLGCVGYVLYAAFRFTFGI